MPVHANDAETSPRTELIGSMIPRYDLISELPTSPRTPATRCGPSAGKKKKNFAAALRGLGCAAAAEVSVPMPVPSAGWTAKKVRKKKLTSCRKVAVAESGSPSSSSSLVVVPDVWCGPGSGFASSADMAASLDCAASARRLSPPPPTPRSGREKIDSERVIQREHSSRIVRRTMNPLDFDASYGRTCLISDPFGARYYHRAYHPSPKGLAEIMLFRSSLPMEERLDLHDRYREWRLDIDNMSYEELLELGDQIGYVNTGLKEDEIGCCLRKSRVTILDNLSLHEPTETESKCSICQEEYEAGDEMGELECGHAYHTNCIEQWLTRKKTCPMCKSSAAAGYAGM